MPVCRECKSEFPNRMEVNGVIRNVNKRKHCLECLPFSSGRKPYITKNALSNGKRRCSKCGSVKLKSDFYMYKKQKKLQSHCKECQKSIAKKRIAALKKKCIEYKGGKCHRCGYHKCVAALEFHHVDPKKKEFALSSTRTRSWNSIVAELDKCELMCANCHKEVHYMKSE